MNHISPSNHPESYLSGSTIESMIDRTKELGLDYFASTDLGTLTASLKGYSYAKKKKIKYIAGIEIFFKDNKCPIIKDTPSENIKYFKLTVHAQDQGAYQHLVRMASEPKNRVQVGENYYPIYDWNDLQKLSEYNVSVSTSNIEGMVSKHLLVDRIDLAMKYYEKLRNMFEDFYPVVIPYQQDKYWNAMANITLKSGETVEIPLTDRVEFEEWNTTRSTPAWVKAYDREGIKALKLSKGRFKKRLTHVFINRIRHTVKEEHQEIQSVDVMNNWQDLPYDIQTKANKTIAAFAERYGDIDRLLIDNYSFYAKHDDKVVQDMKLGAEHRIYQHQYMASITDIADYILSLELPIGLEKLVENSRNWAENFDGFELKYDYRLPTVDGDPKKLLIDQIQKVGRMDWNDPVKVKQFREEFDLLTNNGVIDLIPYFLPIVDVYDYYAENGHLTGPARGSAGGFLISYLLGITHVDPIKYGLSTSRFLTIDRVQSGNLPDIDCDLESRIPLVGADGNSGYLFKKYGNKAAQVSTRTLLRVKSAMLDANRFVNEGKVEEEIALLSKSLPPTPQGKNDYEFVFGRDKDGAHEPGLIELNERLQQYAADRPQEWDIVVRALSLARQNSRHACAYVVSDAAIEDTIPIMEVGGVSRVTQPTAEQCEEAGLIKYDFLVVSSLRDINLCLTYINRKNETLDLPTGHFMDQEENRYIWDLPEDPAVFEMLGNGRTESVFQLWTPGATPTVVKVKPQTVIDCATITSLERPGPKDFRDPKTGLNMVEEYIERRHGRSVGDIPILNEMLPETFGVLVFQEQVTKLAKELAGMNVIDSENVRIAVGKKKEKLIESLKPIFIKGAAEKCGEETATKIWSMMETFARYGFNKSHAVAYSVISYACAYLKHYYPLEWWASILSNADNKDINEKYYQYVKDMVLPPDINTSTEQMSVDYKLGKIRNKLSMVSGLGSKAAEKIIANRPYKDIYDFARKKACGPAMSRKLIHVGVLDSLFSGTQSLMEKMDGYEAAVKKIEWEDKTIELQKRRKGYEEASDAKGVKRTQTALDKHIKNGPKEHDIDPLYIGIEPKRDFLIKKSIFPTMNLDLQGVLDKSSNAPVMIKGNKRILANSRGYDNAVVNGETLQKIDNTILDTNAYFCVPGYIVNAEEFSFAKNTKKALKLFIDSSGYVSEKVLWPDYDSGELIYPESLKKGAIAWFFYGKREDKRDTKIYEIVVEEPSLG